MPRPEDEIRAELGMVQVLGRLALSFGILVGGRRRPDGSRGFFARETVFLLGLIIPAISVMRRAADPPEAGERRPIDWRILGGGIAFGAFVLAARPRRPAIRQEIVFVAVDGGHLRHACLRRRANSTRRPGARSSIASIIIFVIPRHAIRRADGYFWLTLDVLGFDEAF